ncbi:hypothetical protein [Salinispora arenicola]|uniref:Uncharacterized protein n=1 Tax=Salinispora arenicola TaxID=168697 RepID=A0ABQ4JWR6_SALAC|nr:hypothetical protein [Salinispora arenicola]GIM87375.1 hypothetical protein Sar04_41110 [Salinispora arenicola]
MPEEKDEWSHVAEEEATFVPPTIDTSDLYDYRTWAQEERGWRKLLAAVNGGAAIATADGEALAARLVSPQSVMDAGVAFQHAYDTLNWLEQFVRDQSQAIAGEDRAWQGEAADAFLAKMTYFADYIGAQAERIAGGDGTGGVNSVPNQLYKSANYFAWAQSTMKYLDRSWATIAAQNGVGSNDHDMVAISGTKFEQPMTEQMLQVVDTLATQYDFTYSSVTPPDGDGEPKISTPEVTPPDLSVPEISTPEVSMPEVSAPEISTPEVSTPEISTPEVSAPEISTPEVSTPEVSVPGEIPSPEVPPPGENPPPGVTPPGDDTSLFNGGPGLEDPNLGGLPGLDDPSGGAGGGAGDQVVPPIVPPLPGLGNGSGGPGDTGSSNPQAPSVPGIGAGEGLGVPPPTGVFTPAPVPGPGSGGGSGGGGGTPSIPPPPSAGDLVDGDQDDWTGGGAGDVPLPNPPGDTTMPGADSDVPLPTAPPLGADSDVPLPTAPPLGAGGTGDAPTAPMVPGMPMMPGAGGVPGAGGAGGPEKPDANGLIEGPPDDWQPPAFTGVDIPGAPDGTSPGGAGLDDTTPGAGLNDTTPPTTNDTTTPTVPGAPMMPGMPGPGGTPGAASGPGGPEKPDANGLIEGGTDAWEPSGVGDVGALGAPHGTAAGGAGLDVPQQNGGSTNPLWDVAPAGGTATNTPILPGMPGSVASPGDTNTPDHPGASTLVAADDTSWQPSTPDGTGPDAPDGASAGGVGLTPSTPPITEVAVPPVSQGSPEPPIPVPGVLPSPGRAPAGDAPRYPGPTRATPVDAAPTPPEEGPESPTPSATDPGDSCDATDPRLSADPSSGDVARPTAPPTAPEPVAPPTAVNLPTGFPAAGVPFLEAPAADALDRPRSQKDIPLVAGVPDSPHQHRKAAAPPADAEPDGGSATADGSAAPTAATVDDVPPGLVSEATTDPEPSTPVAVVGASVGTGTATRHARRVEAAEPGVVASGTVAGDRPYPVVHPARRSEPTDEREPIDRPDAAELLRDEHDSWGEDTPDAQLPPGDDYVPVVRADSGDADTSEWDDLDDSAWLTEAYADEQDERLTDA